MIVNIKNIRKVFYKYVSYVITKCIDIIFFTCNLYFIKIKYKIVIMCLIITSITYFFVSVVFRKNELRPIVKTVL